MNLTIVKLGGSLLGSPDLDVWIDVIGGCSAPVVIVPGGGSFADHVRAEQARLGFDDKTAHHMALLAMDQVAVLLASRSSRLALAGSRMEIEAAIGRGVVAVWLPSAMGRAASDVPESWDATSDSLAAWLAGALGATRLLLVKSCDVVGPVEARNLADAGIVDPLFPLFVQRSRAEIFVAGPAALAGANDLASSGSLPGVLLATHNSRENSGVSERKQMIVAVRQ